MNDENKTNPQGVTGNSGADDGAKLHPRAGEFDIPKFVKKKHVALVNLILETKSMDDKERQYWFHILPIMSEQQIEKLRAILNKEKSKLNAVDTEYKNRVNTLQQEKVNIWEQKNLEKRFEEIKQHEAEEEKEEKDAEEQLLKKLEEI